MDRPFPLHDLGSGFIRIIQLYVGIISEDVNIILFDEITDGLHPKTIQILVEHIIPELVKRNIQLFAMTHSYDILHCLAEKYPEMAEDYAIYRLEHKEEQIAARNISAHTIHEVFPDLIEVREQY